MKIKRLKMKKSLQKRYLKNSKKDPRREDILKLYKTHSLREIGEQYGISGERVRQIIKGEGRVDYVLMVEKEYAEKVGDILKKNFKREIRRLSTPDRRQEIVAQRRAVVRELYDNYGYSFPAIGRLLNRDHSSIINLYKTKVYGRSKRKRSSRNTRKSR